MANKVKSKRNLTTKRKLASVRSVREAIISRVKERKLTAYKLAKLVAGKMTPQTVYDYLAEPPRTRINDEFVGHLLVALDLEIRPKQ